MAIDVFRLVPLVAGACTLALGGVLLALGRRRGLDYAFGLLLGARGLTLLLPQLSTEPGWIRFVLTAQPAFALLVAVLAAYLLATIGRAQPPRHAAAYAAAASVAILGLYLAFPSLFVGLAPGPASSGAMYAAAGWHYTSFGPLSFLAACAWPLLAILALRLAVLYRAQARSGQGRVLLLLSGGLLVGALFDGANRASALSSLVDQGSAYDWMPWGWATFVLPTLALVPALLAAAVIAANRGIDPRPDHALEGGLLGLGAFALATGFLRLALPADSMVVSHPSMFVLLGAWRLVMPILVTWALVVAARAPHAAVADAPAAVSGGTPP